MTNTRSASRPFSALDAPASLTWIDYPGSIESGLSIVAQGAHYRYMITTYHQVGSSGYSTFSAFIPGEGWRLMGERIDRSRAIVAANAHNSEITF